MRDAGFKTRQLKNRGWKDVVSLGNAYPAMAVQKNGDWLIVISTMADADGETGIAVLDPSAEGSGAKLVTRAAFEDAWDGTLVLCKRKPALNDENQPFGLLNNLAGAMRPGGRVGIVDADARPERHGTPPALLRCELAAVGYRETGFHPLKAGGYLAVFAAPETPTPPRAIRPCRDATR